MNNDHSVYMGSIGMEEPFIKRVFQICDRYQNLTGNDIDDIFVSEYIDGDGNRVYEDLRIFSSDLIIEADQFLSKDSFFFNNISECKPIGWVISSKDFEFDSTSSSSRLTVMLHFAENLSIPLKASGENCKNLVSIIRKYILKPD